MKPFRRIFDFIKGFVDIRCDDCKGKDSDIIELRKQLKKIQAKCNKKRGLKDYDKEDKEVVFKKR